MYIRIEDADGDNLTVGSTYEVIYVSNGIPYVEDDYSQIVAVYEYQYNEVFE